MMRSAWCWVIPFIWPEDWDEIRLLIEYGDGDEEDEMGLELEDGSADVEED